MQQGPFSGVCAVLIVSSYQQPASPVSQHVYGSTSIFTLLFIYKRKNLVFLSFKMVLGPLLSERSADVKKDVEISTSFSAVASFPATRRP